MAVMEALAKERKSYYDWQVGNGEGIFGEIETPDGRIGQVRFLLEQSNIIGGKIMILYYRYAASDF